jgi:hypothetical protein
MGGSTPPPTVPNPKLGALQDALSKMKGLQAPLQSRFDDAVAAMKAGAWTTSGAGTSGASDQFFAALQANQTKTNTTGSDSVAEINHAIGSTPSTIPNPKASTKGQS